MISNLKKVQLSELVIQILATFKIFPIQNKKGYLKNFKACEIKR